ncbi:ABC transporter substrate-binding protein [Chryseolinea sp. H1M3-3]|uniref:heme/hemin ABC transporter substrate-binding protein n=1 Tax=Chryseolinea sp. H1M3-3 TaxID=3034144 RepID=UPI0023EDC3E4|nr:ABC transporter substrate-binding protein [Chryseolinea sp. H1M3-3]
MKSSIKFLVIITSITFCYAQSPERIITAGSAITETVCALGDCDKIIASDKTSLYPVAIQNLPSIGYRSGINAEGILSLKPTMVIVEKGYVEASVLDLLSNTPVKLIIVDRKLNVEDTKKMIRQIATTLGKVTAGTKLINRIENEFAEIKLLLQKKSITPSVLCIYNRGTATISAAGSETFAEILKYAGAENAFNDIEGYKPLNTEALIKANPDFLLMVSSGLESLGGIEGVSKLPGILLTTAGKKKQIVAVESLKLTNFGPRLGEAVREVVLQIHPELVAK